MSLSRLTVNSSLTAHNFFSSSEYPRAQNTKKPPKQAAFSTGKNARTSCDLESDRRLLAVTASFDLEGNLLAFVQSPQTCTFNFRNVNKHILSATFWLNETETLGRVEPFYGACCHNKAPY